MVSYADKYGTNTIEFNLCEQTSRTCNDEHPDYANLINANNTCYHMSQVVDDKHP